MWLLNNNQDERTSGVSAVPHSHDCPSGRLPGMGWRRILNFAIAPFLGVPQQIEESPCGTKSIHSPPSR
jgi:hypothetical protein